LTKRINKDVFYHTFVGIKAGGLMF